MAKVVERFRAKNTNVLVVTQSTPAILKLHLKRHTYPFPVVCDPDRAAYRAFDLERTPWYAFLRQILRLVPPKVPYKGEDVLQLGGDFLLGRDGRIEFAYRSRVPTDRLSVRRLLAAIPETPR